MIGTEKSLEDALECLMGNGLHCNRCIYNEEDGTVRNCIPRVASDAHELLRKLKKRNCELKRKIKNLE